MIGRKTTGCAGAVMSIQIRRGLRQRPRAPGRRARRRRRRSRRRRRARSRPASSARDHAEAVQAALDVGERLLVLEVVAGDQALDDVAGDAELAGAGLLDLELAGRGGPVDAVLGELVHRRPRAATGSARAPAAAARCASSSRPSRVALEVTRTAPSRRPRAPRSLRPPRRPPRASTRSALLSARMRGSSASRGSCSASSRSITAWFCDRVRAVERREVEHVDEQPRALDVGEEVVAEAGAVARALDQPRDVGDHELAVGGLERPEVRLERRERVAGDLRLRAREARDQRRLAGVREPDEPDVGEQLEVQLDEPLLPVEAALGQPRRLAHRAREALVAAAARAAAGERDLLARARRGRSACRPSARPACPGGTPMTSGSPSAPWRCAPSPWPPRSARKCARRRNACRSRSESSTRTSTSPPRPPSPPSGPPLGTWASRRKDTDAVAAAAGANLDLGAVMEQSGVTVAAWLRTQTPSSSSPAPPPASAPPPPATPPRPATGSSSPPARRTSSPRSPRSSAATSARSPSPATSPSGTTSSASSRPRSTPTGASTSRSPTPASAPPRGFQEGDVEQWKAMVLTNVYGAALTIRATTDPLKETQGPPAAHRLGGRPPRAPGLALLRHQVGGHRRWARPRARTSTTPACACR